MKKIFRWILIVLGGALVIIQFVRPSWNRSEGPPEKALSTSFPVPPALDSVLRRSCYDCHSNNTVYPWYAQMQPVGWWLQSHVNDGKRELNFDMFASYRPMRQFAKLQQIAEQIEDDEMPIPAYVFMHRSSRLTQDEKEQLTTWVTAMRDSMKNWYPADSLQRPRRRQPEQR